MRLALAIVGAILAGLVSACSPVRTLEAIDVLSDIAAGDAPSRLKASTPAPRRHAVGYRLDDRNRDADLYEPASPSGAGIVLVAGLAPEGKDDPRLVAFANTLARARFRVLVPDIPTMRAQQAHPTDIRAVADAVVYLAGHDGSRTGPSAGIVAVSYAVGPAVLAALEPDARPHVAFVTGIGGYYDLRSVLTYITTGWFQDPRTGQWLERTPNAYGKWVFALSNADRLATPRDRDLLRSIARRKLADSDAPVSDLAARLGPEGQAVYALLTNTRREEAGRLIGALPATIQDDIRALDLSRHDLSALPGRLILIHGTDDAIIPYSESERLAAALPDKASLSLPGSLAHVDLGPSGIWDTLGLLRAVYRMLAERDAIAASLGSGASGSPPPAAPTPP